MNKTQEQAVKSFMLEQLTSGVKLAEVQRLVNEKFNLKLRFMDIRILASELEVDWKSFDPKPVPVKAPQEETLSENSNGSTAPNTLPEEDNLETSTGNAAVIELNKLARPGMMFSGTVKFPSGCTADWYVDNTGRLGLENLAGGQPTREDAESFQIELDQVLRKAMGR